jgi:cytochrome c oxidase subunit 2
VRIPRIAPNVSLGIIGVVLIALASLWVGQYSGWLMPAVASREAKPIDDLFTFMLVVAAGIFFGVQAVLVYSALFFRRQKSDLSDGPSIHDNFKLELLWTVIPIVLVLYLSLYSFEIYQQLGATAPMEAAHAEKHLGERVTRPAVAADKNAPAPLVIDVQAQQYAWIFTYPEKNITTAELHLPVDRPVLLKMQSQDVIHGFWVPQFRLKQDVIPGRTTTVRFVPSKVGQYTLQCTQLCGAYHGGMRAPIVVESAEDYQKWVSSQSQAALPESTRLATARPLPGGFDAELLSEAPLRSPQTRTLIEHLRSEEP